MLNTKELVYDEDGLIPAIIIDVENGEVLMMAYMNEESLQISISEGRACFWSRSREELWRKGESSGNVQHIVSIKTDCDKDTLLVTVKKDGPACHTGEESCFFEDVYSVNGVDGFGANIPQESQLYKKFSIELLHSVIKSRKIQAKPGSYTNYLFEKGIDKILKKIGEESTEVIIAGKEGNKKETIYELADLTYHILVLMTEMDISLDDVLRELESRQK